MEVNMRFELYRDAEGDYRWRLRHQNGNVIADSGEGYRRIEDCKHAIMIITSLPATTPIKDMTAVIATEDTDTPSRW
jgi:uncharacterized protein YegP (UPF0339 family)